MSKTFQLIAVLVCAAVLAGFAPAAAKVGWYTTQQADDGHILFNNHCAECHRPDLSGALGPALIGQTFQKRWGGQSVESLFRFEHENMPANSPGSLPNDEVMAMTAYILKRNGLPAGNKPLTEKRAKGLTMPAAR